MAEVVSQASGSVVIHPHDIRMEDGELVAVLVFAGPREGMLSGVHGLGRDIQGGRFGEQVRVVGPEGNTLAFEEPWRPSLLDAVLSSGGFPPGPRSEEFSAYQTELMDSRLVVLPIESRPRPGEYMLETRSGGSSPSGLKFLDMAVSVTVARAQDGEME